MVILLSYVDETQSHIPYYICTGIKNSNSKDIAIEWQHRNQCCMTATESDWVTEITAEHMKETHGYNNKKQWNWIESNSSTTIYSILLLHCARFSLIYKQKSSHNIKQIENEKRQDNLNETKDFNIITFKFIFQLQFMYTQRKRYTAIAEVICLPI